MQLKYTIFKEGLITKEFRIYSGILKKEENQREMKYRIEQHLQTTELYGFNPSTSSSSLLLKSKYTNWSKTKSMMEGFNGFFPLKKGGMFSIHFTFQDPFHHQKSYTWEKESIFDSSFWLLKDDQGHLIADFEYATWSRKRQGVLTIYHPNLPSYLMACIILSHMIVSQTIRRYRSNGAASGGVGGGGC